MHVGITINTLDFQSSWSQYCTTLIQMYRECNCTCIVFTPSPFLFVSAMVILYISTTCISNPQKTNAGIFALKCLVYFKEIKRKKCFSFNQDIYHLY